MQRWSDACSHQMLEEARILPQSFRKECSPCWHLDLGLLAPSFVKECISVVLGFPVCGTLLQHLWEANTVASQSVPKLSFNVQKFLLRRFIYLVIYENDFNCFFPNCPVAPWSCHQHYLTPTSFCPHFPFSFWITGLSGACTGNTQGGLLVRQLPNLVFQNLKT